MKGMINISVFKKYRNKMSYEDLLQLDGAFSAAHINYGKSPRFNKVSIKDLNIGSINNSLVSRDKIEDVLSYIHSFDGTEKDFNNDDRILLWKLYWLEYINAFDKLIDSLPNSVVTAYVGRQSIEIGFKYLLLKSTGKIEKTHDLKRLSDLLFKEYSIDKDYMEYVDVFCEKYCQYIEGGYSEYFRYPEYIKNDYFAGNKLDINWLSYNFVLIIMKLIHFAELEKEL